MSNGGDTSHSFAAIYAGRASHDTCFSGELTVDDKLTVVNNTVAVNRSGIHSIVALSATRTDIDEKLA